MQFQNGFNKVVIELQVKQFWSEIIRVISKLNDRAAQVRFQTKIALPEVQLPLY